MPYAVTHVLTAIIASDLIRDYSRRYGKYFTLYTVFLAGVGGLLPDIDLPIMWMLSFLGFGEGIINHGIITHTPFFAILFLIPALYLLKKGKVDHAMHFGALAFGILTHIILDFVLGGGASEGVMFFFPVILDAYKLHLLKGLSFGWAAGLDAILLLLWLYHEEVKHKIKDFI